MAVPGTGSTNQTMTIAAYKKLQGKAHTSTMREHYEETIPSNVQINTSVIFGDPIPQSCSTDTLYARFSSSVGQPETIEYVEFYIESISGTTYDANDGTFGQVGFGGGDEAQNAGPHGFQLRLTSSYESLSSYSDAGSGVFVNDQLVNASNGTLQLVSPSFGPQSNNKFGLEVYTSKGGTRLFPTDPTDWFIDYYNGIVFMQDYNASKVPRYAKGFIYIGKFAQEKISDAAQSGSSGGTITALNNKAENRLVTIGSTTTELDGEANLTFDGSALTVNRGMIHARNTITNDYTITNQDYLIGADTTGNTIKITLPNANTLTNGQVFVIKDEGGNAGTNNIEVSASSTNTIDGMGSFYLQSPHAAVNIYCDGTSKYFIY